MDQQYQALVHALLAIPFIERTEERIQAELNYQVWARHRMGELETNELDAMVEVSIKKAVAMPTDADVYVHFKEAVRLNLQANILNRKPTLLEVCQAADEEMKCFPVSYGPNKGVKYEIVRTKIINEIECVDDICEGCGGVVEGSQWGGTYCSHYCWARSDND
jgi:hypothetical protein